MYFAFGMIAMIGAMGSTVRAVNGNDSVSMVAAAIFFGIMTWCAHQDFKK